MARGGVSPGPTTLPVVSFTKVEDEFSSKRLSVPEQAIRSYGYNDGSDFKRPEHYIRYIEPLESELAVQVEYDMDEQDQQWLDALNIERRAKDLGSVPYEIFEIVMDRLEKEWFDLTKNIPKPDLVMPSEDSTCAICDDSEGENTNAIVFCDGCNLAVHQDCYGVPYIPEGQWLCRKCTVSPENPVSCILCPNEGGAFKQTVQGEWVHLLCAIWVPETRVANDVFMEPVTGVDRISKQRWKLKCSICDIREGACIQCTKSSCFLAFHATCARKEKFLMPMKASQGSEAPTLACYCERHLPREQAEARVVALAAEQADVTAHTTKDPQAAKTARAYAKTYKPGPPLVPAVIVRRIEQYIARLSVRHKRDFIVLVCKYWSLKREGRRGAPLLKRLHLEPWTASANGRNQSDEDKAIKLEFMKRVREDLVQLRDLAVLCRKRESRKVYQQETIQRILNHLLLTNQPHLRMAFETIMSYDKMGYFKDPVSKLEVPDYYDIIKNPICWNNIDQKLDQYEYWDVQTFKDDVHRVLDNAMVYNKADTTYWKAAQRIRNASEGVFADLEKRVNRNNASVLKAVAPPTMNGDSMQAAEATQETEPTPVPSTSYSHDLGPVGDVEPSLSMLELLVSQDTSQNPAVMKLLLDKLPIEALFSYDPDAVPQVQAQAPISTSFSAPAVHVPIFMPVPVPVPAAVLSPDLVSEPATSPVLPAEAPEESPITPTTAEKPKRDRKAERERRQARERKRSSQPHVGLARTRRALAAIAAFEAEAAGDAPEPSQPLAAEPEPVQEAIPVETEEAPPEPAEPASTSVEVPEVEVPMEVEREPSPIPPTSPAKRKHKRPTITLPGQSEVPPVVEDVDNQQSFMMFDAGWILPNDQRRHGRAPVEKQPVPEPKRKKPRTSTGDREKSHASAATAGASIGLATPAQALAQLDLSDDHVEPAAPPAGDVQGWTGEVVLSPLEHVADLPEYPQTELVGPAMAGPSMDGMTPWASVSPWSESLPEDLSALVPAEQSEMTEPLSTAPTEADADADADAEAEVGEDAAGPAVQAPEEEEEEDEEDDSPPRIIIIEELDTPATRREKNMRKKAERARAAAARAEAEASREAEAAEAPVAPDADGDVDMDVDVAGDGDADADATDDVEMASQSELTSLSSVHGDEDMDDDVDVDVDGDVDGAEDDERGVMSGSLTPIDGLTEAGEADVDLGSVQDSSFEAQPVEGEPSGSGSGSAVIRQTGKGKRKARRESRRDIDLDRGKLRYSKGKRFLEGGTLVWAKLRTYPWWPAVVFEPDDPLVDADIVQGKTTQEVRRQRLHLVRFYDNKNSWYWLEPSKLKMLGDDTELDADMLAASSTIQKWKTPRTRDTIRSAFRRAISEMEADAPGTSA